MVQKDEGLAREIINRAQKLRKKARFSTVVNAYVSYDVFFLFFF